MERSFEPPAQLGPLPNRSAGGDDDAPDHDDVPEESPPVMPDDIPSPPMVMTPPFQSPCASPLPKSLPLAPVMPETEPPWDDDNQNGLINDTGAHQYASFQTANEAVENYLREELKR